MNRIHSKNILSLTSDEVMDFFMKSEQFHGFELPEYFDFDNVLAYSREIIGEKKYEDCITEVRPDDIDGVNLDILFNKDGHYAVRPMILANPFLYYFLTRELCCPSGWQAVMKCFEAYTVPHITSNALPVIPEKTEAFYMSASILNWWNTFEQRSLELSLEYRYMFVTDITNCYGSINPQSIEWALLCKNTKHENKENLHLAENVKKYLRAFQHGHNIGIPQGSALFDFVAEIILGYSDLLLHEALQKEKIKGYEIIRYRDDYRVFCSDKDKLEKISYILQAILESLNFRMNSQKTKLSDNIVIDSIKKDKLFYIYNTPVFNKKGVDFDGIQKYLLYVLMFSRQFPNSGQIRTMLSDIDKRIIEKLKPKKRKCKIKRKENDNPESILRNLVLYSEEEVKGRLYENIHAMTAVAVQIAIENVSVTHYALRIISRMVDSMDNMKEKKDIIKKVYNILCKQHNSDYNQLWLQNMTYTQDKKRGKSPYTIRLCKLVMGDTDEPLWNNDWLKPELSNNLPYDTIVNKETLKLVTPVITFRETRAYNEIEY